MMGETVTVYTRSQTGTDSMGEPVYEWNGTEVENVLVRPVSTEDMDEPTRPDGITVEYHFAFPKTFAGELRHARIALTGRGWADDAEEALRVTGSPDFTQPCPTLWNILVDAGRAYG